MNFDQIIDSYNLDKVKKIAVAVSGGSDSMALTFLLYDWCIKNSVKLVAISIDHGLRLESKDECEFVKKILFQYNIEHYTIRWLGAKPETNILAKAREARYRLLIDCCKKQNISNLFVGHNKEDVAETFLLNLERGSGIDGLSAMRTITKLDNINIIRPLLSISRTELKDYLNARNVAWINDPSNDNSKYTRVKIRKNLLEEDLLIDRIVLAANHIRLVKTYLDKKINELFPLIVNILPYGVAEINLSKYFDLDEYEQITILTKAMQTVSGSYLKPRFNNLKVLHEQILANQKIDRTFMHCHIKKVKAKLFIFKEDKDLESLIVKNIKEILWDNRFKIVLPENLLGQEIVIASLGKEGWQKLDKSKIKISHDLKILPKAIFFSFPVLKVLEKAIFIPYLNYVSEDYVSEIFPETDFVFKQ